MEENMALPWLSPPGQPQDDAMLEEDDFHLPEMLKEEILMRSQRTKRVVKTNVLRAGRLFVVIAIGCALVGGIFFLYMIFRSKDFANFAAIVLAYVLSGIAISSLVYLYVSPILLWVWSGKLRLIGARKQEIEVLVVTTIFSFVLLDVSGVLFYHEGMYLSVFHYFHQIRLI